MKKLFCIITLACLTYPLVSLQAQHSAKSHSKSEKKKIVKKKPGNETMSEDADQDVVTDINKSAHNKKGTETKPNNNGGKHKMVGRDDNDKKINKDDNNKKKKKKNKS